MTTPSAFRTRLDQLHRHWRRGLIVAVCFRWMSLFIAILFVYGFCDFWLGLEVPWRVAVTVAIAGVLLRTGWRWLTEVNRLTLHDMGRRADELLGASRTSILSAHELQVESERVTAMKPFTGFLVARAIADATAHLHRLAPRTNYPSVEIQRRMKMVLLLMVALGLLIGWQPRVSFTILSRLFQPLTDIAPYSRYEFRVDPEHPRVLYGGSADIAVEITGGTITGPVWFATRRDGEIERTPCFQEAPHRFAQKVENVTESVDFRFETGRARSNWKTLIVRMQPHITLARATVTPPAYTRRAARNLFIGQENLSVLRGSEVRLVVTSNRPLEEGTLLLRARDNPSDEAVVKAIKTGEHTVAFEWKASTSANVEVMVRDVQGAESPEPLKLVQKVVLDEPPVVTITEPAPFSLATPDTVLALRGYAEDDIGLQRADLVRAASGYRERSRPLEVAPPQARVEFQQDIALQSVGVQPGDVLEFYLQAADVNPTMLGVSSSDVVRVQIISTEQYTEMVRARTTIEEFAARYDLANQNFDAAKKALEDLQKAASDKNAKPEDIEKALQEARQAMAKSKEFFEALQKDLAAFDADGSLKTTSGEIAAALDKTVQQLNQASATDPNLAALAAELAGQMDVPQKQLAEESRKGNEIAQVGRLMESANRLSELVRSQENLVRKIGQRSEDGWQQPLEPLADRQEQLRQNLEELVQDIEKQSANLPGGEEYRELGESARKAAQRIKSLKIGQDMQRGTEAGRNSDRTGADKHGSAALKKLKSLLSGDCGGFGAMCEGQMKFSPKDDVRSTLQQMCQSMARRFGHKRGSKGPGGTGGGGAGGFDDDGYWVGNMSPLNIPIYGPSRIGMRPTEDSSARGHQAQGGAAAAPLLDAQSSSRVVAPNKEKPRGEALSPEDLPEKYRDSILRYFSTEPKATP